MLKTVPINFRISPETKENFFNNAKKLGISPSSLLNMFIVNFNKHQKVTFSINEPFEFQEFIPDKTENIIADFAKTKKYNKNFLKDLEQGLNRSRLNK